MRVVPTSSRDWERLLSFPFRAYTVIAFPFYLTLGKPGDFAVKVVIGYLVSGVALLLSAAVAKYAQRDAAKAKIDLWFACVAFVVGVFMLPETAPLHL